nr:MAG TPA: hypothetical protein [Caudoviricetes sp.]
MTREEFEKTVNTIHILLPDEWCVDYIDIRPNEQSNRLGQSRFLWQLINANVFSEQLTATGLWTHFMEISNIAVTQIWQSSDDIIRHPPYDRRCRFPMAHYSPPSLIINGFDYNLAGTRCRAAIEITIYDTVSHDICEHLDNFAENTSIMAWLELTPQKLLKAKRRYFVSYKEEMYGDYELYYVDPGRPFTIPPTWIETTWDSAAYLADQEKKRRKNRIAGAGNCDTYIYPAVVADTINHGAYTYIMRSNPTYAQIIAENYEPYARCMEKKGEGHHGMLGRELQRYD